MTAAQFEASAFASAPAMGDPGLTVGARILGAVKRTRRVVDCNTNLGIALLCAPLAQAALSSTKGGLRERLQQVLASLDVADAEHAFAAIRLAQPGGLGAVSEHDVRQPATATLAVCMAAAMDRDSIARQYVTGFADVFEIGVARLRAGAPRLPDAIWATTAAYLAFLARLPDSHIARKFGMERAMEVCAMAQPIEDLVLAAGDPERIVAALLAFDADLKSAGLNPGTSADLTVASLFAVRLQEREIGP